ncbi:MAG: anti-sigma factor family protein [Eubacteriales bacterium]
MKPPNGEQKNTAAPRRSTERTDGSFNEPNQKKAPGRCPDADSWEMRLYEYAEGNADEALRRAVEAHTRQCAFCKRQLADIQEMMTALRTAVPAPPAYLKNRVMDEIRREEENGRVLVKVLGEKRGRTDTLDSADAALYEQDAYTGRKVRNRQRCFSGSCLRMFRCAGGLAAVLVLVIGLACMLPILSALNGSASASHDVVNDMRADETGAGFVDGVFLGAKKEPAEEDTASADTECTLGSISNAFSDRTDADEKIQEDDGDNGAQQETSVTADMPGDTAEDIVVEAVEEDAAVSVQVTGTRFVIAADGMERVMRVLLDTETLMSVTGWTEEEAAAVTVVQTDNGMIVAPASAYDGILSVFAAENIAVEAEERLPAGSNENENAVYIIAGQ